MKIDIIVPKAGLTMTEATVSEWLVSEGDQVNKDDPVAELMTEKMTVEVSAPETGIIGSILRQKDEEVKVGETLATLVTKQEELEQSANSEVPLSTNEDFIPKSDSNTIPEDAVVIGGGPGGYVAAIRIAQLGGKVTLIERDHLGGTCLNSGCIPTKTLLKGSELAKVHQLSTEYGVSYQPPTIDFSKLLQKKDSIVQQLQKGISFLLNKNNVTIKTGTGEIITPHQVNVTNTNGESELIDSKTIILATGSEVHIPPIPGLQEANPLTSKEALEKEDLPESIAIIGAGAIGCEFAGIYSPLGVNVTLIESESEILPGTDQDVAQVLKKSLKQDGVEILTSSLVKEMKIENGEKTLYIEDKDRYREIVVREILVATGRKANIKSYEQSGLKVENGRILVDEQMRTNEPMIFAIGDVTGIDNLAHVASTQGIVAAENAMGLASKMDYQQIPRCIYTSPEIASVGLTEKETMDKGIDFEIGKHYFSGNGRALSSGDGEGFVKVIRDKKYNQILGIHIVGPNASELISEGVVALNLEATTEELASTVHPHPTLSEGFLEAALASMGRGIHS